MAGAQKPEKSGSAATNMRQKAAPDTQLLQRALAISDDDYLDGCILH